MGRIGKRCRMCLLFSPIRILLIHGEFSGRGSRQAGISCVVLTGPQARLFRRRGAPRRESLPYLFARTAHLFRACKRLSTAVACSCKRVFLMQLRVFALQVLHFLVSTLNGARATP